MLTVAQWSVRHRKLIIVAWIAALIALMGASRAAGDKFANNLTLPATDSTHGTALLQSSFPAAAGDQDQIVFHTSGGEAITNAKARAQIARTIQSVRHLPHVVSVVSPFAQPGAVAHDSRTAF